MMFTLGELVQQTSSLAVSAFGFSGRTSRALIATESGGQNFVSLSLNGGRNGLNRSGSGSSLISSSNGIGSKAINRGAPLVVRAAESATPTKPQQKYPGEKKGFVEEMRFVAMKLHTKDQAKEGEKKSDSPPVAKWDPTIQGFLKFLVNNKVIYDCMEEIVEKAAYPAYAHFRNTGLERSAALAKDLDWLKSQGHEIPAPAEEGTSYAELLKNLSETDPPAFICHFYNVYFAHSAGGRMIGRKVCESVLDGKELEFYKWEGDLQALLSAVKEKLNLVAENWTREEKNHCLEQTELSFKYSGKLLRLIIS
ncbi:hypothetical protein R1sor_023814 [Riccia sorocarpa]|uniref:heme oxygenase (biliverdin-producing) n=1 Tax=Riccia sorocarpa TaxID=122646 RepID=A0ABD3GPH8_9MARC